MSSWCHAADYVIHISVDGLRPDYLQTQINLGKAPSFKRFQDEGAWTHNARTDYTHTITLPNHTSMITGRPVSLPVGMPSQTHHGYTANIDPPPTETVHNFTPPPPGWYKASTFDVVHDAGFTTAMYASKSKFILYEQSYNAANGAPHANGSDKINTYYGPENTAAMQTQLLSGLAANHFNYTFIHYADTDDAGHSSGWGSAAYNNAIVRIDDYLGQVFNLVENDATLVGRTAIVLSSDHGGNGTGHSTSTNPLNYTIPFYAWGTGVDRGDIYSFNTDSRTNPGTLQQTYTATGQPIRNGDGGNLALDLLGLGPIPGSLINFAQDLRVDAVGDFNDDGFVDAADYAMWRKGLGTTYTPEGHKIWRAQFYPSLALDADFNGNNTVDAADYAVWRKGLGTKYSPADYNMWRAQFGRTLGTAGSGAGAELRGANAVPEPSALAMLLAILPGALPILFSRPGSRHRRRQL